ncbi:unnamed protein product [Lactuca saligna]|uniref:Protein kinase domain-containing protein n=1 Tax=Lactuca saligna TaxID=75948 RepID=A0AA36EJV4_LACSI|nr:unnamed protein product [Lactuca saligna]
MSSTSSYKQFAHLKIPLEEIQSATNNFSDANIIRKDAFGYEYKGQLLRSGQLIDIVARRLDNKKGLGNKEFWMEVSLLCTSKHRNLVSIVGFCDESGEKMIINKHETRGSLYEYLGDPVLTWIRRLEIFVGVAKVLSYIYHDKGCDFSVIHSDIKSSKILLDDEWEAKLSGFELSITQAAARRNRLCLTDIRHTSEYSDPTYVMSGSLTHKSDVYSLAVILFELLCGKDAVTIDADDRTSTPLAKTYHQEGRIDDMADPGLRKQMNPQSFRIFKETIYYCFQDQRSQRPNINQILIKLEKALECQRKHENPVRLLVSLSLSPSFL